MKPKTGTNWNIEKEQVFYYPEDDSLYVVYPNNAYVFEDEVGQFIVEFRTGPGGFETREIYWIGEL